MAAPPTGVNVGALDVAVDSSGNLYIYGGNRVYKVSGLSSRHNAAGRAPAISANGVVNGASFQPGVAANSWVTIQGTNLAAQTDDWSHSIVNGALPTSLDGVSVTMGGKPAYVYFISPGQLNVLAPDVPAGPISVTVTTAARHEYGLQHHGQRIRPCVFPYGPAVRWWQRVRTIRYAVKAGTFAGATTVPAKPGEVHYPLGNRIRSHDAGSAIGRLRARQRRLFDGIRADGHGQQHAGDGVWRRARARLGRLVPDRHPGPQLPSPMATGPFKPPSAASRRPLGTILSVHQ